MWVVCLFVFVVSSLLLRVVVDVVFHVLCAVVRCRVTVIVVVCCCDVTCFGL